MAARRFLWIIAGAVVLVALAAIGYRLFGDKLIQAATTPSMPFAGSPQSPAPDYAAAGSWIARPGLPNNPSLFAPAGFRPAPRPAVAVFYLAPTTYVKADRWNAPVSDAEYRGRLASFTAAQASIFNGVGAVWAPVYRQAVFGAFLSDRAADRDAALALAYGDVRRAWAAFLAANPSGPVIVAGHSQGALHLARLLAETAGRDPKLKARIVAAYLPGWPLSVTADLEAIGLPPCVGMDQQGCAIGWQSFAEPADPKAILSVYNAGLGLTGQSRRGSPMLCVNPIRGFATEAGAVAAANLGALRPNPDDPARPTIVPAAAAARCQNGLLLIGPPPAGFDRYVLPGNNYHVYDMHLFWANLRADAERRANAWMSARLKPGALPEVP